MIVRAFKYNSFADDKTPQKVTVSVSDAPVDTTEREFILEVKSFLKTLPCPEYVDLSDESRWDGEWVLQDGRTRTVHLYVDSGTSTMKELLYCQYDAVVMPK